MAATFFPLDKKFFNPDQIAIVGNSGTDVDPILDVTFAGVTQPRKVVGEEARRLLAWLKAHPAT